MAIAHKIGTFWRLPMQEKLATAEAAIALACARLIVNLVPLSKWRDEIAVSPCRAEDSPQVTPEQRRIARTVMHVIRRVSRNAPVEFVCLPQALSARWMLSRRGVPTQLFLGTRHAAESEREFHAWLKVGTIIVTGHCTEEDYVVFGVQTRD